MKNKAEIFGQFFTKINVVEKLLSLLFSYKKLSNSAFILEPSFGTGNFIHILKEEGFKNIDGCEIDRKFTKKPSDFFLLPLRNKYDLIIGNPPFTKYNLKDSYCHINKYIDSKCSPDEYLANEDTNKNLIKIENAFILKSLKHLKGMASTIAFILPISFFIKNKNKSVKKELLNYFSTIIIYQNDETWFDRNIPCCFVVFTNISKLKNRILLIYENDKRHDKIISIKRINEEIIPKVVFNKNQDFIKNIKGIPLRQYLDVSPISFNRSLINYNVSAANILTRATIPIANNTKDYKIAVVRVGNGSIGKCGLINSKKDILNDMFYVFDVKNPYYKNKHLKENICHQINKHSEYFKNITCRVGSKSIKKEDIYNFKVDI